MLLFRRRAGRLDRATSSEPQRRQPHTGVDPAIQRQAVQIQSQPAQVNRARETINLLEADLGALIGDVHSACERVRREAEIPPPPPTELR